MFNIMINQSRQKLFSDSKTFSLQQEVCIFIIFEKKNILTFTYFLHCIKINIFERNKLKIFKVEASLFKIKSG